MDQDNVFQLLERIVVKLSEWSFRRLKKFLQEHDPKIEVNKVGDLDIRVMGSNEESLNEVLNSTELESSELGRLLANEEIQQIIQKYLTRVARTPPQGRMFVAQKSEGTFWMHLPLYLPDREGFSCRRDTLFLSMPNRHTINSIGIGFDDSKLGDLSLIASLYMARWLGKRV